jgi:hypothetical protein
MNLKIDGNLPFGKQNFYKNPYKTACYAALCFAG